MAWPTNDSGGQPTRNALITSSYGAHRAHTVPYNLQNFNIVIVQWIDYTSSLADIDAIVMSYMETYLERKKEEEEEKSILENCALFITILIPKIIFIYLIIGNSAKKKIHFINIYIGISLIFELCDFTLLILNILFVILFYLDYCFFK